MSRTLETPTPPPRSRIRTRLSAGALALAAALALGGVAALPATQAHAATDTGVANGDVIANLWEWNWDSVASECTNVLDPAGYGAVQVAPPAESLKQSNYYWWDVYQPYSYNLNSRFGTATQFANMVTTCHNAGIKVYVDAVINHTAAQTGTGYNGTTITTKYDTPDWDYADYHHSECTSSDGTILDYSNLSQVQNCELLGLPDLKTENTNVRQGIAGYLNKMTALGVDGYRIDAAKHIPTTDLAAIEGYLNNTTSGSAPYVFQEVYPGTTPTAASYEGTGDVLDFVYANKLKAQFQGSISNLETFGSTWGFVDEGSSATFVTNHDTDRNGYTLTLQGGDQTTLANIYELARSYGTSPSIYASWNWTTSDQAPPNSSGFVTNTDCSSGWTCLDRNTAVKGMVEWHNAVGSASYTNFQAKASNVIGFSRGTTGFIAMNNTSSSATYTYATNLADGTYCNVITDCADKVTVSSGSATITVPAMSAVAIHTGTYTSPSSSATATPTATATATSTPTATATATATTTATATSTSSTVTATFNEYASTDTGTNVYVVGSNSALGNWDTSSAIQLSSGGYPIWTKAVSVPASSSFEYKYIKKDSSGNVTWESNANRSATTGTSAVTLNNSWNVAGASATDVTFNETATTISGTNVYVVGSIASLGSWDTDDAIPLSSTNYPTWSKLAIVPQSTSFTYKYIKKDANGNVTWESGDNRSYTTGTSSGYTTSDTWK
ncbi:carbohydrate-binding module family 20 domain-containing protein [Streptomyces sp. NPDC059373]